MMDPLDPKSAVYTFSDYAIAGGPPPQMPNLSPQVGPDAAREVAAQAASQSVVRYQQMSDGGLGALLGSAAGQGGSVSEAADSLSAKTTLKEIFRDAFIEASEASRQRDSGGASAVSAPSRRPPEDLGLPRQGASRMMDVQAGLAQELLGGDEGGGFTSALTDYENARALADPMAGLDSGFSIDKVKRAVGDSMMSRMRRSASDRVAGAGYTVDEEGGISTPDFGVLAFGETLPGLPISALPPEQQQEQLGIVSDLAQGSRVARAGRAFAGGLAEGEGVVGAAGRALPAGALKFAGVAGAAYAATDSGLDWYANATTKADQVLAVTGEEATFRNRLGTLGYFTESKFKNFFGRGNGLTEMEQQQVQATALEIAGSDEGLRDSTEGFLADVSPYVDAGRAGQTVETLLARGSVNFKQFEEAIIGVGEAALEAGANAKDLRETFLQAAEAASSYASAQDAINIGQATAQSVADAGTGFEDLGFGDASSLQQRALAGAYLGVDAQSLSVGLYEDVEITADQAAAYSSLGIDVAEGDVLTPTQTTAIIQTASRRAVTGGVEQQILAVPEVQAIIQRVRTMSAQVTDDAARDQMFKEAARQILAALSRTGIDVETIIVPLLRAYQTQQTTNVTRANVMEFWLKDHIGVIDQFGNATEVDQGMIPEDTTSAALATSVSFDPGSSNLTIGGQEVGFDPDGVTAAGNFVIDSASALDAYEAAKAAGNEGEFIRGLAQAEGAGLVINDGTGQPIQDLHQMIRDYESDDPEKDAEASAFLDSTIRREGYTNTGLDATGVSGAIEERWGVERDWEDVDRAAQNAQLPSGADPATEYVRQALDAFGASAIGLDSYKFRLGDGQLYSATDVLNSDLLGNPNTLKYSAVVGPDGQETPLREVLGANYNEVFSGDSMIAPIGPGVDVQPVPMLQLSNDAKRWFEVVWLDADLNANTEAGTAPGIVPPAGQN